MAELYVIGRIQSGSGFPSGTGYFCKWTVQAGSTWKKISGVREAQTQVDTPASFDFSRVQWSHPIDIHFVTNGLQGWPKLILEVCRQDKYGRSDLSGYGVCHIPATPGTHIVEVPTWRPAGTGRNEIERHFLGGSTELSERESVSSAAERYRLRTKPSGIVTLELGIILKNFAKCGIES